MHEPCELLKVIRTSTCHGLFKTHFTHFLTVPNSSPDEKINSVFCHILFAFRAATTLAIPSSKAVIMAVWWKTYDRKYYDRKKN